MTSLHAFRLELPAGDPFTGIARDVARRYAEVLGAASADAEAFGAAVARAIEGAAGSDVNVELAFAAPAGAVEVHLQSGGRSSVVRRDIAAGRT
jgi:hypothetical protein